MNGLRRGVVGHGLGAAVIGIEFVAQDHKQPRLQIRAGAEFVARLKRLGEGFLRQIIGQIALAAQRTRESTQHRHHFDQAGAEGLLLLLGHGPGGFVMFVRWLRPVHASASFLPSIFWRSDMNSSGTGSEATESKNLRRPWVMAFCCARCVCGLGTRFAERPAAFAAGSTAVTTPPSRILSAMCYSRTITCVKSIG